MKYNDREDRNDQPQQRVERDWERDLKDKRAKRRQFKEKDRYGYEE
jgi:hypothetical protein